MKQIWAPWRMEYVTGGNRKEEGCLFCRLLGGPDDKTNLVLKRWDSVAVVMNRYPYMNGHLMICPVRHVAEVGSLDCEEKTAMMDALADVLAVLRRVMKPEGFNTGINIGAAAGAGAEDHLHMHIVPRWNGDTNFMPVIAETSIMSQHLDDLWGKLYPEFNA